MPQRIPLLAAVLVFAVVLPATASAQNHLSISAGVNSTRAADVSVTVPSAGLDATSGHDVHFAAKPFKSPQYYPVAARRSSTIVSASEQIEFEFTHLKVISDTSRSYATSA